MERRLVQQGRNALTVTLPADWLKKSGLDKGDLVFISNLKEDLMVSAAPKAIQKEITLSLKESVLKHGILGSYVEGYRKMIVKHSSPSKMLEASKLFIGMAVTFHSKNKTVMEWIGMEQEQPIGSLVRRCTYMLQKMADTLLELSRNKAGYKDVLEEEFLLNQQISYAMRQINMGSRNTPEYKYFYLCSKLEQAGDYITFLSRKGCPEKLALELKKGIDLFARTIFSSNAEQLRNQRNKFEQGVKGKDFVNGVAHAIVHDLYNFLGYMDTSIKVKTKYI